MRTRSRRSDLLPAVLAVVCITLTGEKICVQLSQASPTPGAPYTHVTTKHVLSAFGMCTLRDLPDIEALEDAGLFGRRIAQADAKAIGAESDGDEGTFASRKTGKTRFRTRCIL